MPSIRRKLPLSTGKKKSLFSISLRNVMKQRKSKPGQSSADSDGSYLPIGSDHMTVSGTNKDSLQQASTAPVSVTNQAILTVLNCLEVTNQDLSRRMERIEQQGNKNFTPMASPRYQSSPWDL